MDTAPLYASATVSAGCETVEVAGRVLTLEVTQHHSGPAAVHWELSDPDLLLADVLTEGCGLTVSLGTSTVHDRIFAGEAYAVELSLTSQAAARLVVTGYDQMMRLGLRRRSRAWAGGTPVADVIGQIGRAHGFGQVDAPRGATASLPAQGVRQQEETDLAFVLRLTAEHGLVVAMREAASSGARLECMRETDLLTGTAVTTLTYRGEGELALHEFVARCDVADVALPVIVAAQDRASARAVRASEPATVPGAAATGTGAASALLASTVEDSEIAERLATVAAVAGQAQKTQRGRLGTDVAEGIAGFRASAELVDLLAARARRGREGQSGWGRAAGDPGLRPRTVVTVQGVGRRFGGDWYVTAARHVLADGRYHTEFSCRR